MLVNAEYIMRIHWTVLFGIKPHSIEEIKNDENEYAYIPIPVRVGTELCWWPKHCTTPFIPKGSPMPIPNRTAAEMGIILNV